MKLFDSFIKLFSSPCHFVNPFNHRSLHLPNNKHMTSSILS